MTSTAQSGSFTLTMRSAVVAAPRRTLLRELPVPAPGPREVRVRLQGCGLCASSLPVWQGREWFRYPLEPGAPGHEGWGIVDAVGDEVADLAPGDRVAMLSSQAFAEHDIADADHAVRLPHALADQPFPGEALACAINVFRRCDLRRDDTLAVIGIGFLGALIVQLAAGAGVRVIALSRRPFGQQMATSFGASLTGDAARPDDSIDRVTELTEGRGCDCVVEATGYQPALDLGTALIAERGRLVIAGYHQDGLRRVNMQQWNWKGIDVINAHERDPAVCVQGLRDAVQAAAEGRLDPLPLYTHVFCLNELDNAFHLLEHRSDGFIKALVMS